MNGCISKFLSQQGFDKEKLEKLDGCRVYSDSDVNWIVSKYRIYKNSYTSKEVCIADVKGYDYEYRELGKMSLFENMDGFFDENGAGYEKRSLSMLEIPTEEIISQLSYSFTKEPIYLIESDKGKFTISSNGLHRYHIIKTHYLKELASLSGNNQEELDSLRKKYTFETRVDETDFFKTYSHYLLSFISKSCKNPIKLTGEKDKNYQFTGNSVLIDESTKSEQVLNDSQLASYLKKSAVDFLLDRKIPKKDTLQFLDVIKNAYSNFESFRDFYNEQLAEIIPSKYVKKIENTHFNEEEQVCE